MRRLLCVYLVVSLSCRSSAPPVVTTTKPTGRSATTATKAGPPVVAGGRPTVAFDGSAGSGNVGVELVEGAGLTTEATTSELGAAETKALLTRLEALPDLSAQNAKAPALKAPSPPPPRAGSVSRSCLLC